MYRVVVGEIVATGKGPSKKKAKHNAAQEALEKIREVVASAAGQDMSQVLQVQVLDSGSLLF